MDKLRNDQVLELIDKLKGEDEFVFDSGLSGDFSKRVVKNLKSIKDIYKKLTEVSFGGHSIRESERIFDNFYIIDSASRDIIDNLSKEDFKKTAFILKEGEYIPRIYYLVSEAVKLTDSRIDSNTAKLLINEYQKHHPLSLRELGNLPTIIRLVLIKNSTDIMERLTTLFSDLEKADKWLKRTTDEINNKKNPDFEKLILDLNSVYGTIPISAAAHIKERLLQYSPDSRPLLKWFKLFLKKQGIDFNKVGDLNIHERSAEAATLSNIFYSLRWLSQIRWEEFESHINLVDKLLKEDASGIYADMDHKSKVAYRDVLIKMSDKLDMHEVDIVKTALEISQQEGSFDSLPKEVTNHIGFYLIGKGYNLLEKKVGYKPGIKESIYRFVMERPNFVYFSSLLLLNFILGAVLFVFLWQAFSLFAALLLLPIFAVLNTELSNNLISTLFTNTLPPIKIPRLKTSKTRTNEKTFIVVPALLRNEEMVRSIINKLEVHYLANRDEEIFFALLGDLPEADRETLPMDKSILQLAKNGINELNRRYPSEHKKFYFISRKRVWNPNISKFVSWERKRGAIHQFNQLILNMRNHANDEEAEVRSIENIKYVIILDEDTDLPFNTARKLIGTISHPLNKPVVVGGKVVHGYGIIQPRIKVRLSVAYKSLFSRLFSGASGMDSYSHASSDLYRDLFKNAIFYGKGIYDVETFNKLISPNIPENLVLSHDLLEGLYTKVGLSDDVSLFDGFPKNYHQYINRAHRWIRGDWQLIKWFKEKNFSLLDKWKIFDNLRLSIVPTFLIGSIFAGILLGIPAWMLVVYFILILSSSFILEILRKLFIWKEWQDIRGKVKEICKTLYHIFLHVAFRSAFLIHQAVISTDAILRTIIRVFITKKNLLQWRVSQDTTKLNNNAVVMFYVNMFLLYLAVSATIMYTAGSHSYTSILLWSFIISAFLTMSIALSGFNWNRKTFKIRSNDRYFLRKVLLRTVYFFLDFSNEKNNWLISDRLQKHSKGQPLTNREVTSPTNLGMLLTSLISAYDFGYLGIRGLEYRLSKTISSIKKLEKFRGHLFNWYDTLAMKSTTPRYVSSVDSANFAVTLLLVKQALIDIKSARFFNDRSIKGISDMVISRIDYLEDVLQERKLTREEKKIILNMIGELSTIEQAANGEDCSEFIHLRMTVDVIASEINKVNDGVSRLKDIGSAAYSDIEHKIRHAKELIDEQVGVFNDFVGANNNANISLSSLTSGSRSDSNKSAQVAMAEEEANNLIKKLDSLIYDCEELFENIDFSFLYNKERGLFHVGYNADFNKIDDSYYDFLASEANSVSLISIMKRQAPVKSWFHLSRKLAKSGKHGVLTSWGGSLFEYLTPLLFVNAHRNSLIGKSARRAIKTHIRYGKLKRVLWGMGESASSEMDFNKNYHYQIFGVPDIGLKRGLGANLVSSPYTVAMSINFFPKKAINNLRKMVKVGAWGRYGFYDAIDFISTGIFNRKKKVAKVYYAHHQGFIVAALNNLLNENRFVKLFHSDSLVSSVDSLLEEKFPDVVPSKITSVKHMEPIELFEPEVPRDDKSLRKYIPVKTAVPRYGFISNGNYNVVISNSGAGYSSYKGMNITPFHDDHVMEKDGYFIYLRDIDKNITWSATPQPIGNKGVNKVIFEENRAEFEQEYNDIKSNLSIYVGHVDNVEIRELRLKNAGSNTKNLDISSFGEVVLLNMDKFKASPAFNNLFVKSEFISKDKALLFKRYIMEEDRRVFLSHSLVGANIVQPAITDKSEFIGRMGNYKNPACVISDKNKAYSNKEFSLNSIYNLNAKLTIKPGEEAVLYYVNIVSEDEGDIRKLIKKYKSYTKLSSVMEEVHSNSIKTLNDAGISSKNAILFQELLSNVIIGNYNSKYKLPDVETDSLMNSLWSHGISGDKPILVIRINELNDIDSIKTILSFFSYASHKGINLDLVILNEHPSGYLRVLDDEVDFLIRTHGVSGRAREQGGVFHIKAELISKVDIDVILAFARVVLDGDTAIDISIKSINHLPGFSNANLVEANKSETVYNSPVLNKPQNLLFYNGFGGFDSGKHEYVMYLDGKNKTPAPWTNIIAGDTFGFMVSESGSSHTWSIDSYDNRLTAFPTDSVQDPSPELIYIKDVKTGDVWSPLPAPYYPKDNPYISRHGQGYSQFEYSGYGFMHKLTMTANTTDKVKLISLSIKNTEDYKREIKLASFFELVLGVQHSETKRNLEIYKDTQSNCIIAENKVRNHFANKKVFLDMLGGNFDYVTDRLDFWNRMGNEQNPAIFEDYNGRNEFMSTNDGSVGMVGSLEINPGETKNVMILLGEGDDLQTARNLVEKYRIHQTADKALDETKEHWRGLLGKVKISSPDNSLDILFNDWLIYQVLSSRIFAKTGYYQPGGAIGFRDQLQDAMALAWVDSRKLKDFILYCASHQFKEGDVQVWWHKHNSFGLRKALTDQQLWLPYAVAYYIEFTGDYNMLNEEVNFIEGPEPNFHDGREWAGVPNISEESASVYEHCIRAIEKNIVFGSNGLPLIGMGDWNDGLNRLGILGKGESVWTGWLLYKILNDFVDIASDRGDMQTAERYISISSSLKATLNSVAWDGDWYMRAFSDEGDYIGSRKNKEMSIDSVAQSWSVLSGGGNEENVQSAIKSSIDKLLKEDGAALISPPFKTNSGDVGYIENYPPGVRENGSQYNHAANWLAQALILSGYSNEAKDVIDFINPILRSENFKEAIKYRVEPYSVASDIYLNPDYSGRGGWTWYTGSAGLLYRTILEFMLGLRVKDKTLAITPALPKHWPSCNIEYVFGSSKYIIKMENTGNGKVVNSTTLDNDKVPHEKIPLVDDGKTHEIIVKLS